MQGNVATSLDDSFLQYDQQSWRKPFMEILNKHNDETLSVKNVNDDFV